MSRASIVIGLSFAAITARIAPSRADIVSTSGFEPPTYAAGTSLAGQDGWVDETSASAILVTTTDPRSGPQAVQVNYGGLVDVPADGLFEGDTRHDFSYNAIASGNPIETVTMSVRLDGPGTNTGHGTHDDLLSANLVVVTDTGRGVGSMVVSSNGNTYVFAHGLPAYSFGTATTLGVYHELSVQINFATGAINYDVDGGQIGTNLLGPTIGSGVGYVRLDQEALDDGSVNASLYTAHYDDLGIRAVPCRARAREPPGLRPGRGRPARLRANPTALERLSRPGPSEPPPRHMVVSRRRTPGGSQMERHHWVEWLLTLDGSLMAGLVIVMLFKGTRKEDVPPERRGRSRSA